MQLFTSLSKFVVLGKSLNVLKEFNAIRPGVGGGGGEGALRSALSVSQLLF